MAAVSQIAQSTTNPQLRPINPRRDLGEVADLIELCFTDTIDPDGQRYLRRMRQAAQPRLNRWFDSTAFQVSVTAEGFVWEESEKIVWKKITEQVNNFDYITDKADDLFNNNKQEEAYQFQH